MIAVTFNIVKLSRENRELLVLIWSRDDYKVAQIENSVPLSTVRQNKEAQCTDC